MSNELRIAISGKSGCGNSTVSRLVADKLNLTLINYTFKNMAEEMGVEFEELCEMAESDTKYDFLIDKKQVELFKKAPRCVLGSRLAIWLLTDAFATFYLDAAPETRAKRIAEREGKEYSEAFEKTAERDRRDRQRYIKLYKIDINKHDFVDLHIDANSLDQYAIAEKILEYCRQKPP